MDAAAWIEDHGHGDGIDLRFQVQVALIDLTAAFGLGMSFTYDTILAMSADRHKLEGREATGIRVPFTPRAGSARIWDNLTSPGEYFRARIDADLAQDPAVVQAERKYAYCVDCLRRAIAWDGVAVVPSFDILIAVEPIQYENIF